MAHLLLPRPKVLPLKRGRGTSSTLDQVVGGDVAGVVGVGAGADGAGCASGSKDPFVGVVGAVLG